MPQPFDSGSKPRFRVSLLLLTVLFFVKIWILGGHATLPANTAANERMEEGFTPVTDENASFWGMAGDIMGIIGGGRRSRAKIDREIDQGRAQRQADDEASQRRFWKEDEERRADEHERWEQEREDYRQQKQQEQDDYDRRQREQEQYDQQRRDQDY